MGSMCYVLGSKFEDSGRCKSEKMGKMKKALRSMFNVLRETNGNY